MARSAVKITGYEKTMQNLRRIANDSNLYQAEVRTKNSSVVERYLTKIGWRSISKSRDAAKNQKIIRIQQAKGRNPFFLDQGELDRILPHFWTGWDAFVSGAKDALKPGFSKMADMFLKAVKKHIDQGRSEGGPMRPLSDGYEVRKVRKYKEQKPILVATGMLLKSLFARAGKLRKMKV